MRVLSLGAGVQSTTLFLMACEGEESIDCAIFADTGWEPAAVYAHLERLETVARGAGLPIHRVTAGNIREDSLGRAGRLASMPAHLLNTNGSKGQLKRQCTAEYKVRPIRKWLRSHGVTRKDPVELVIGISWDEAHRMRDSEVQYARHAYPLVDRRMTRRQCQEWLSDRGYGDTPKSSCIGCPFRSNAGWRSLTPAEFADAVAFDQQVRRLPRITGRVFLHPSLVPLDMVDLRSAQDRGQMEMDFDGCGVLCAGEAVA